MRSILVGVAALFVCAFAYAQSGPAPRDSAVGQSAKVSPSPDGKPGPGAKPDRAGKIELRDVKSQESPASAPLVLKNTGALSTEDAARSVALQLAKQGASERDGRSADSSSAKAQGGTRTGSKATTQPQDLTPEPAASSDAVMEFQPASSGSGAASSAGVTQDGTPHKSPPQRVHGDLYGTTSAVGHAAGGSVGATSKSRKTSVYVQSDEARRNGGQPQ
jgi:hypothetical protein